MPIADAPEILIAVVAYLAMCIVIGLWAMRRTHTSADFFIAGQSLGPMVVALAAMSSIMSGFGFVGGPGLVYESGVSSFWMVLVCQLGVGITWTLTGKRLRLMSEYTEVLTLPDAVAERYGGRLPRLLMAIAILLGVIGYLGAQLLALGAVLVAVLQVPLPVALLIGLGVLAFYSAAGGILAGVYTDVFQGALMLVAALGVFYYVLQATGGLSEMSQQLWAMDPNYIGPYGTRGPLTAMSWFLLFAVGNAGQPHVITKFLMLKRPEDLRWGPLAVGAAYAVLSLLWMGIGLAMRTLVHTGAEQPLADPDLAAPVFLLGYTPAWLTGLVFAGLLAAIMSTADSFLNLGAASVVRDIPIALRGHAVRRELLWSRVATAVLLAGAALFALYMENLIALLGTFGWGTFAAAIVPSIAIGLNWKRANALGCILSIATSLILNFALELLARNGVYTLPFGLNVGAVSLLAALIVFFAAAWFGPPTPRSKKLDALIEV